jgi:flagellar biosynthesis GTPase FlhF
MSSPAKSKASPAKGSSSDGSKVKKAAKRDPDHSDYDKFATANSILPSSHTRNSYVKSSHQKQVALLSAARRLITDEGYIQIRELTGSGPLSDVAKHELAVGIACCVVALANKASVLPAMTDVQRVDAIHVHQAGAFLGLPTHNEKLYGGERVSADSPLSDHLGEAHTDESLVMMKVAHEVHEETEEKRRKTDEQYARRAEKLRKEEAAREAERKRSRQSRDEEEEKEKEASDEEEEEEQPKPKKQKKRKGSSAASPAPAKQASRTTRSQARSVSRER